MSESPIKRKPGEWMPHPATMPEANEIETIESRAEKVLREIDEAVELAEKATPGPWLVDRTSYGVPAVFPDSNCAVAMFGVYKQDEGPSFLHEFSSNTKFIAASRTGWRASLRCLSLAIRALLEQCHHSYPEFIQDDALKNLASICREWEEAKGAR